MKSDHHVMMSCLRISQAQR